MDVDFNVKFAIVKEGSAYRFRFYCELSGMAVCETKPIEAQEENAALIIAKELVRPYFNRCNKCGRWICDQVYNIDEMECIECNPYKAKPAYCTQCGSPIQRINQYCTRCGHKAAV